MKLGPSNFLVDLSLAALPPPVFRRSAEKKQLDVLSWVPGWFAKTQGDRTCEGVCVVRRLFVGEFLGGRCERTSQTTRCVSFVVILYELRG